MVIVANEPPYSVCIRLTPVVSGQWSAASETTHWNLIASNRQLLFRIAIPVPVPRSTGRIEHLKTSCQLSAVSFSAKNEPCHSDPERTRGAEESHSRQRLALAELEALSC